MKPITTTLNEIRSHEPCSDGWEKLLKSLGKTKADDEPLELVTILESNDIADAVWCLGCLSEDHEYLVRLFACACAESVLHLYENEYPEDFRVRNCIETSKKYALGLYDDATWATTLTAAGAITLTAAGAAAWATTRAAAGTAAWATARAAAGAVCDATVRDAEEEKQTVFFKEYFGSPKTIEEYKTLLTK